MKLSFLVTAEVDRDSGLFASRDELGEKVNEAIASGLADVDLSGVGPNSDSAYTVTEWGVDELSPKSEREALELYDARVAADYPGDAVLRDRARRNALRVKDLEAENERLKAKLAEKVEAHQQGATRIMHDVYSETPIYIREDDIYFQLGDERDGPETLVVSFGLRAARRRSGYAVNEIEIRSLGSYLSVIPRSGNVIAVRPTE